MLQTTAFAPSTKPVAKPLPPKGPMNCLPGEGGITEAKAAKIKALGGDSFLPTGEGKVVAKIQLPKDGAKPSQEELAAMKAKIEAEHGEGKGQVVAKIRLPKGGAQPSAEELAALKAKIEAAHEGGARPTTLPNREAMDLLKKKAAEPEGSGFWAGLRGLFGGAN